MRKFLTIVATTFITGSLFAGGLVTNTNQSASWVRLPVRDASVSIDAAYYNPAGLTKLKNGFHFSISNQTISQNKSVVNLYAGPGGSYGLNQYRYDGKVSAPIFPNLYAVYKKDRLAFSLGFNPIGGGGSATFKKGLPSFEISPSDLVPSLGSQGVDAYRLDAYFEGTSIFFGFQGGVSYKINDVISVAAGLRYVSAKNTYLGHLKDIEVEIPTGWTRADVIMTGIATSATNAAVGTTAMVAGGAGTLTLAQAQTAGIINATTRAQLEGALTAFGSATTVTIATADAVFKGAAAKYTATATLLGDQEADVTQTGSGITPIFSVNITPMENLNIGIKYEMATSIELTQKTAKDFTTGFTATGTPITMFPDGELISNDLPAMLSVGLDYTLSDNIKASIGYHTYFDKSVNYGHKLNGEYVSNDKIIDKNFYEIGAGLECKINDKLLVSAGYLLAKTGVNKDYQSDLTYSLTSSTFGAGGAYQVLNNLQVNLGVGYSIYNGAEKYVDHIFSATGALYKTPESYSKNNVLFAIGVDFSF